MNCYIMVCKGSFNPSEMTHNQCKVEGHTDYEYSCKLVFSPKSEFDENEFLIDHADVDKAIVGCELKGSCERMHLTIMESLKRELKRKGAKVLAIKLVIIPVNPEGVANLTYVWTKNNVYLTLLNQ